MRTADGVSTSGISGRKKKGGGLPSAKMKFLLLALAEFMWGEATGFIDSIALGW